MTPKKYIRNLYRWHQVSPSPFCILEHMGALVHVNSSRSWPQPLAINQWFNHHSHFQSSALLQLERTAPNWMMKSETKVRPWNGKRCKLTVDQKKVCSSLIFVAKTDLRKWLWSRAMAGICHEGEMNFAWDEELVVNSLPLSTDTCTPLEGLCYYSLSRSAG